MLLGSMVVALGCHWRANATTHLGALYGNAAADWLGSFVTVVATKFWFERGSLERGAPSVLRGTSPTLLWFYFWSRRL